MGSAKESNNALNGDHTSNTAVAHMKAYKSVKDYMQLTLVNQNEVMLSKS